MELELVNRIETPVLARLLPKEQRSDMAAVPLSLFSCVYVTCMKMMTVVSVAPWKKTRKRKKVCRTSFFFFVFAFSFCSSLVVDLWLSTSPSLPLRSLLYFDVRNTRHSQEGVHQTQGLSRVSNLSQHVFQASQDPSLPALFLYVLPRPTRLFLFFSSSSSSSPSSSTSQMSSVSSGFHGRPSG